MTPDTDGGIGKGKHLLVIRLSALGDVAMTLPAIYSLARRYPQMRIFVLTRRPFARIFVNHPDNVKMFTPDLKKKGVKGLGVTLALFMRLRRHKFDYVVDLHNVLRSWVLGRLLHWSGARWGMVDKMREGRRAVLHGHARQPEFISRYIDTFRRMGFEVDYTFKTLYPDGAPEAPVDIPAGAVGIAPFARYETKTYPVDLMEQVVKGLSGRGVPVFLFGGRGREAEIMDSWAERYDGCVSLAGRFAIRDELAMMSRLTAMVAMDSANHHLAALTGVRVLSIWGGTTPACGFMAYGQKESDALCLGLDCQPCSIGGSPKCKLGTPVCMRGIKPETVIGRVMDMLNEKKESKQ